MSDVIEFISGYKYIFSILIILLILSLVWWLLRWRQIPILIYIENLAKGTKSNLVLHFLDSILFVLKLKVHENSINDWLKQGRISCVSKFAKEHSIPGISQPFRAKVDSNPKIVYVDSGAYEKMCGDGKLRSIFITGDAKLGKTELAIRMASWGLNHVNKIIVPIIINKVKITGSSITKELMIAEYKLIYGDNFMSEFIFERLNKMRQLLIVLDGFLNIGINDSIINWFPIGFTPNLVVVTARKISFSPDDKNKVIELQYIDYSNIVEISQHYLMKKGGKKNRLLLDRKLVARNNIYILFLLLIETEENSKVTSSLIEEWIDICGDFNKELVDGSERSKIDSSYLLGRHIPILYKRYLKKMSGKNSNVNFLHHVELLSHYFYNCGEVVSTIEWKKNEIDSDYKTNSFVQEFVVSAGLIVADYINDEYKINLKKFVLYMAASHIMNSSCLDENFNCNDVGEDLLVAILDVALDQKPEKYIDLREKFTLNIPNTFCLPYPHSIRSMSINEAILNKSAMARDYLELVIFIMRFPDECAHVFSEKSIESLINDINSQDATDSNVMKLLVKIILLANINIRQYSTAVVDNIISCLKKYLEKISLSDRDSKYRSYAILHISNMGTRASTIILEILNDSKNNDSLSRTAALYGLGDLALGKPQEQSEVVNLLMKALDNFTSEPNFNEVDSMLKNPSNEYNGERSYLINILQIIELKDVAEKLDKEKLAAYLKKLLVHKDWMINYNAAFYLLLINESSYDAKLYYKELIKSGSGVKGKMGAYANMYQDGGIGVIKEAEKILRM